MRKMVGIIGLVYLHLIVACSSMAPTETRQPTAVTDFKSVSGKWEGVLIRDHPMTQNYDRVTLVIDDTGAYENAVRTRTTAQGGSVSSSVIGVFAEKGKLVLTDGKLSAKGAKGGQATLELYVEPGSSERMLKVDAKDSEGFTYSAELKRTGDFASAK
jgi:hypothetical protein